MSATDQPTLAQQIDDTVGALLPQLPPEAVASFRAESAQRRADGVPAGVATPGTPLPDGELLDAHGAATSLTAVRDGRPALVVFYRGAWCPYCNVALRAYEQELAGLLADRGVVPIAVSPQKPDGLLAVQESAGLSFAVLSDPGNGVAAQLGIVITQLEATRAAQATIGMDVASSNVDGTDALPMPTVLLTDAGGTIRWIDVHPDHASRTEPQAIRAALAELAS